MKIDIIAASKIKKDSFIYDYITNYLKRLSVISLNIIEFDEKNLSTLEINQKLFKLCKPQTFKIILDEKGNHFNSLEFTEFIKQKYSINNHLTFLIAGSDGFLEEYKKKSNYMISLSKLTFPHQLARLIIVEQLYRAQTIITKHPYHRN